MQGPWAKEAPIWSAETESASLIRPEELAADHLVLRRVLSVSTRRSRPAISGLAAALLALIGLVTLSAAGLATPETGLTVRLPEATPFAELVGRSDDGSGLPLALTEAEQEAIRAAIEAELATHSGYEGPVPAGMVFRAASSTDRERALQCMTQAIYYEAGTEPEAGQRAVAQVVLNRVRHPSYANSICGVVYEGSERSTGCQFTFTCDGALARRPVASIWARAQRYAREAIDGRAFSEVGYATHYHTLDIWPYWGRRLTMTNMIGRHLFHRLRGSAGGPGAFTVRYSGREPAPRPWRPRTRDVASAGPAETEAQVEDGLPPAPVALDTIANSGLSREPDNLPGSRPIENALPDSRIRPEYRDSGRWIGG
ncbi:cell wall hydrolase [Parasphingopyxis algicola]|nr:cell wall hydrolase [Parasphingopyxis algicola]